jgi:taurine dioxygenase
MTITFHPLCPILGAEVRGFDPCKAVYSPANVLTLQEGLSKYRVLLFRGFDMDIDAQVRVSEAVAAARLTFRGGIIYSDTNEKATFVSNVHKDGLFGNGELSFHSDLSFTEHILKARSLYSLILPSAAETGGETLFSDVTLACKELEPGLRKRAQALSARFETIYPYPEGPLVVDYVRPLIGTHPVTGKPFIAASRAVTKEVIGMERSEFRPLLKEIWAHMEKPEYIYRHRWQLNELVLWDNIAVQHARTPFDPKEKRALRAVSLDEPAIAVPPPGQDMRSFGRPYIAPAPRH